MESGWKETMIEKDEFIIQSLENAKPNEIIIHSDIDIQFFKNINENFNFSIFDNYDILLGKLANFNQFIQQIINLLNNDIGQNFVDLVNFLLFLF